MNTEKFTQEELAIIKAYSVSQPLLKVLIFYLCVLFAPIAFAVYGLITDDALAVFIAVGGLLAFIIWHVSTSMKSEKTFNAIFQKILAQDN